MESYSSWISDNSIQLVITIIIVLAYLSFRRFVFPRIEEYIARDQLKNETLKSAIFSLNFISILLGVAIVLFTWGFDFRGLLAISTGVIAVTGVAMFANWSILSNVTAFFILIAHQSYRRGNYIRVIELDNFIEGYIAEINLFNTRLLSQDREVIIYPNNLLIARPVLVNPRTKYSVVGKIQDFTLNEGVNDGESG